MVWKLGAIATVAALSLSQAFAQIPPAPGNIAIIYAGALLDRPGKPARGPATIVVQNGKIVSVSDGYAPAPADATVIDLKTRYVLPGFIDAHVHLNSDRQDVGAHLTESQPLPAFEASWNARKTLLAGFTTVRNTGDNSGGTTMALREAIKRGWVEGPRILDAGKPVTSTYGHGDARVGIANEIADHYDIGNICDSADECRKATRLQIGHGADVIKIVATGLSSRAVGDDRGAQMTKEEMRAVIETAHQAGLKVAAHAHGGIGLRWALESGIDSIEHGTLMYLNPADIALLKKSGAFYVPTLATVTNYQDRLASGKLSPEWRKITEARIAQTGLSVEKAVAAGVPIVLGTDAGFTRHGENALEFVLLGQHGLTPMQAIQAGTTTAAELLGVSSEAGSIEPGKNADIVAVAGDPLRDLAVLRSVRFVMRTGVVYKNQ